MDEATGFFLLLDNKICIVGEWVSVGTMSQSVTLPFLASVHFLGVVFFSLLCMVITNVYPFIRLDSLILSVI